MTTRLKTLFQRPELFVLAGGINPIVSGTAEVIVSGDGDLLDLNPFRGIPIVTPAAFVRDTTR